MLTPYTMISRLLEQLERCRRTEREARPETRDTCAVVRRAFSRKNGEPVGNRSSANNNIGDDRGVRNVVRAMRANELYAEKERRDESDICFALS
jgi:hypothetical protein